MLNLSAQTISMLLLVGVLGGVSGFLIAIPYFQKKGITPQQIDSTLETIKNGADTIDKGLDVVNEFVSVPFLKVLDKIAEWAKIAAGNAQELLHNGTLSKEDRLNNAENIVYTMLKELKIDITDDRKVLIDAVIHDTVYGLGHEEPTDVEKEAEKRALKDQLAQTQAENTTLKNTISQIQNTVGVSQIVEPTAQQ